MTHPAPSTRRHRTRATAAAGLAVVAVAATALGGQLTAPAAVAADEPALLSTTGTTWSYTDDGRDPAAGAADRDSWTTTDFDDGAWKTARGSFGAKNGLATGMGGGLAVDTLLTQYKAGVTPDTDIETYFFRTSFDLTAEQIASWSKLAGDVTYDDALVVFVNGTKVAGFEDTGITQNVQYGGDNGGDPDRSSFTVDASLLQPGENTVAMALYQGRASSSDVYVDLSSLTPVSADAPVSISDVVLNVGATERERRLAWYSDSTAQQVAQVAPAPATEGDPFPVASASTVLPRTGTATDGQTWHHAELGGLAPSSSYVYRVGSDVDGWSDTSSFTTGAGEGGYEFLFIGDSQIGASGDVARDQQGWTDTLDAATGRFGDAEFLLSAGDQVDTASNEAQYEAYLAPEQMRSLPSATNIGNHDVGSLAYEQHFNMPNVDMAYGKPREDRAGGDYWFTYDDTLYISLNSNDMDDARHAEFAEKVIAEHGDDARWTVVTFHHSVYSVASHANDEDIVTRRAELPPVMSELDVDMVLMGHDHVYVRSYLMSGTTPVGTEQEPSGDVTAEGDEVLYVTANSSSGSKYYDIVGDQDFDFSAVQNQEYTPNFTHIGVERDAITMTTYRSEDLTVVDEVTLHKAPEQVEPPVEPTDPPVDPGTPPTDPTQPPVDPTEPPVEPGTPREPVAADPSAFTPATRTLVVDQVDRAAGTVRVTVPRELAGAPLDWFAYSEPAFLSSDPTDDDGRLTLTLPADIADGEHVVSGQRVDGSVAAWGTFTLSAVGDPVAVQPGAGQTVDPVTGAIIDPVTGAVLTPSASGLAFTGSEGLGLAGLAGGLLLLAGVGVTVAARRRAARS
ncbi:purple acid phosphatase family protein [Frigoribacterium salinisoli]